MPFGGTLAESSPVERHVEAARSSGQFRFIPSLCGSRRGKLQVEVCVGT